MTLARAGHIHAVKNLAPELDAQSGVWPITYNPLDSGLVPSAYVLTGI